MTNTTRATAEARFAALTRHEDTTLSEIEAERRATQEKTERLRALRLAREAEIIAENTAKLARRRAKTAL